MTKFDQNFDGDEFFLAERNIFATGRDAKIGVFRPKIKTLVSEQVSRRAELISPPILGADEPGLINEFSQLFAISYCHVIYSNLIGSMYIS